LKLSKTVFEFFICSAQGVLTINQLCSTFAGDMYLTVNIRRKPAKKETDSYCRLIESYLNETDSVRHRNLLHVSLFDRVITIDDLNQVRRIICKRCEDMKVGSEVFDIQYHNPHRIIELADKLWNAPGESSRIVTGENLTKLQSIHCRNIFSEEDMRMSAFSIDSQSVNNNIYQRHVF